MTPEQQLIAELEGDAVTQEDAAWLTSYGDLITILLVFFLLLISVAKVSNVKFEQLKESFNGRSERDHHTIAEIYEELERKVTELNLTEVIQLQQNDTNVAILLRDNLLFDSGKADVKPATASSIMELIELFERLPDYASIAIEGYTDDQPVNRNVYSSNWELSALRAMSVLQLFEAKGLCSENCEIRGFGETRPYKPNRDLEGAAIAGNQSLNRRVIIRVF